jgi:hypothetical protein
MRFPSSWLPDHARAITNKDKDWPELDFPHLKLQGRESPRIV